jgi:hypothetical protein
MPPGRALLLDQALQGLAAFLTGIPLVFLPWIAFVLFFAWRFPKTPPPAAMLSQAVAIRLASLTAIVTLALMAALLLFAFANGGALFGISRFAIHYLFPFSLFAALALAGLSRSAWRRSVSAQRLAIVSLAVALVIFFVKLAALRAVGRRAHKARARLSAIRDAVATRRRQPRHLFAKSAGAVVEREDRASAG